MGSARNRSVCVKKFCSSQKVCYNRFKRPSGDLHRCIQPNLEIQSSLDISTPKSNTMSVSASQQLSRSLYSDCFKMGTNVLDGRPDEQIAEISNNYQGPRQISDRSFNGPAPESSRKNYSASVDDWVWSDLTTLKKN